MTTSSVKQLNQPDIPPKIAKRAVEWLIEWQSADDPEKVWQSIFDWRQLDHRHDQAWQHIENINKKLSVLSEPETAKITHKTLTTANSSRRNIIKALSILAFAGGSGWLVSKQQPWQNWLADYYTEIGEQQSISLNDGTEISLNSDTAIDVLYTATERRVKLVKGEIYIRSARLTDHNRPFIIEVPQGELQPIGTRFSVRQITNHSRVAVYEGKVQVQPATKPQRFILDSGKSLTFTQSSWSETLNINEIETAWTRGMIVTSDMRLQDFLTELNRHRTGVIQCDPDIANLKVSGTYPINQADKVLQTLSNALPIRLQSYTRYWVRVLPAN